MDIDVAIDEEIIKFVAHWPRQMKMAMLLAKIHEGLRAQNHDISIEKIAARVEELVQSGFLVAFGNLAKWRHCEIKLANRFIDN